ncbi:hypothetical protein [Nocardiopsis ansamitocini]|uniref:Uncharacterized protein n=1 Tax=Nocardiopsis ansamitocini TaxID=1670832 RepID=A0A9W6P4Y4_9ACTN|nr:hypothetical protein [Nocardiopsis ansamitocini]GLU47173.1 hypothetical protein Nans01_15240 [Nocardiopsis ansamitocini]
MTTKRKQEGGEDELARLNETYNPRGWKIWRTHIKGTPRGWVATNISAGERFDRTLHGDTAKTLEALLEKPPYTPSRIF